MQIALACSIYNVIELYPQLLKDRPNILKSVLQTAIQQENTLIGQEQTKYNINRILCFIHTLRFLKRNHPNNEQIRVVWPFIDFNKFEVLDTQQVYSFAITQNIQR
jgi:hypothetical protein